MSEESPTPDLAELSRRRVNAEARAVAERLAQELE
jgi:hypothetical protein